MGNVCCCVVSFGCNRFQWPGKWTTVQCYILYACQDSFGRPRPRTRAPRTSPYLLFWRVICTRSHQNSEMPYPLGIVVDFLKVGVYFCPPLGVLARDHKVFTYGIRFQGLLNCCKVELRFFFQRSLVWKSMCDLLEPNGPWFWFSSC